MSLHKHWASVFARAKHGHILWDGNAENPFDPMLAHTTALDFVQFVENWGFFKKGNKILDLGCGNGRFATVFCKRDVQYTGIDPCKESIQFCQSVFGRYKQISFQFADVWNEIFNPTGSIDPSKYEIPFPNQHFDDVIVYSVFTHLQHVNVAQNYIKEVKRVLKPGGKLFCTWYRYPPTPLSQDVARTVFAEHDIMNMMNGMEVLHTYGGHSDAFYDQWCLICAKPQFKQF
jgi:SAM-dependent methyltransferase